MKWSNENREDKRSEQVKNHEKSEYTYYGDDYRVGPAIYDERRKQYFRIAEEFVGGRWEGHVIFSTGN
jgi:hypothetical protein